MKQHKGGDDGKQLAVPEGWVAVPGAIIVREKHHKKYNTRDEIDERLETEEVHHLGNVTNQVHTFSFIEPQTVCRLHPSHFLVDFTRDQGPITLNPRSRAIRSTSSCDDPPQRQSFKATKRAELSCR